MGHDSDVNVRFAFANDTNSVLVCVNQVRFGFLSHARTHHTVSLDISLRHGEEVRRHTHTHTHVRYFELQPAWQPNRGMRREIRMATSARNRKQTISETLTSRGE